MLFFPSSWFHDDFSLHLAVSFNYWNECVVHITLIEYFLSVYVFPPRMKYIWTGHMCAVAASGVCGPELWSLLLKVLRCHSRFMVGLVAAASSYLIHSAVVEADQL